MKKQIQILIFILGVQVLFGTLISHLILVYADEVNADEEFSITWKANTEPDLAGYNVHQSIGDPGPPYDFLVGYSLDDLTDPDNPKIVLTLSEENIDHHIVVTAFDIDGYESDFSNEICLKLKNSSIVDCSFAGDDDDDVDDNDGGGGGCFISVLLENFP